MQAYWITKTGDTTQLQRREEPVPQPGAGEMRVRMKATSINRGDIIARIGRHSAAGGRPAGVDGAGEVCELGAGVTAFQKGDRVIFRARGCFAEYAIVESVLAAHVPALLSWEEAAAIPIAYITAYEALVQFGQLQKNETVLIAGVTSGVGVAAAQAAKYLGARVIGVSRHPEKILKNQILTINHLISSQNGTFAHEVLQATGGRGVDLAINLVGGSVFGECMNALADFGRQVVVGYVDGQFKTEIDLEALHGKRLQVMGISNAPLAPAQRAAAMRGFMDTLYPAFASGAIRPVIDRVFDFDALPDAKRYVETNSLLGKVIIRVP